VEQRQCIVCDSDLVGLQRKYCSAACQRDRTNRLVRERRVRVRKPIHERCHWHGCRNTFPPQTSRFCSGKCENKYFVAATRKGNKIKLVRHFGGSCIRCGYDEHVAALHFHHVGNNKEFNVGADNLTFAYKRLLVEAQKCVLLCSNCHATHHAEEKALERASARGAADGICDWTHCENPLEGQQKKFCSKKCSLQVNVVNRRFINKRKLVEALGGKCSSCGFSGHQRALHFHHLDPSSKKFQITPFLARAPFESLLAEARKCVLLCGNCHAVEHAG
jgi:hypothetical protein